MPGSFDTTCTKAQRHWFMVYGLGFIVQTLPQQIVTKELGT